MADDRVHSHRPPAAAHEYLSGRRRKSVVVEATTERPETPWHTYVAMVRVVNSTPPTFAVAKMSVTSSSRHQPRAGAEHTATFAGCPQDALDCACNLDLTHPDH